MHQGSTTSTSRNKTRQTSPHGLLVRVTTETLVQRVSTYYLLPAKQFLFLAYTAMPTHRSTSRLIIRSSDIPLILPNTPRNAHVSGFSSMTHSAIRSLCVLVAVSLCGLVHTSTQAEPICAFPAVGGDCTPGKHAHVCAFLISGDCTPGKHAQSHLRLPHQRRLHAW